MHEKNNCFSFLATIMLSQYDQHRLLAAVFFVFLRVHSRDHEMRASTQLNFEPDWAGSTHHEPVREVANGKIRDVVDAEDPVGNSETYTICISLFILSLHSNYFR